MAAPVAKLIYANKPTSLDVSSSQGIMALWRANLAASAPPGAIAFSHSAKAATRTRPRTSGTRTWALLHAYETPPHVSASTTSPNPDRKRSWPPVSTVLRRAQNRAGRLEGTGASTRTRAVPSRWRMGRGPISSLRRTTKTRTMEAAQMGRLIPKHQRQFVLVR